MDRYIEQLIEDLRKAGSSHIQLQHCSNKEGGDDERFIKELEEVENVVYGDQIPMSEITGISTSLLPPREKLNEMQAILLVKELDVLLNCFHFVVEFPEGFPIEDRYSFYPKIWEDKYVVMNFGTYHIELCSYDPENCPFPGYCSTCLEYAESGKSDEGEGGR
ncbi:MAG: hypothetical protein ACEPOZ_09935 [Marinifilaceae bacterium]